MALKAQLKDNLSLQIALRVLQPRAAWLLLAPALCFTEQTRLNFNSVLFSFSAPRKQFNKSSGGAERDQTAGGGRCAVHSHPGGVTLKGIEARQHCDTP